MPPRCPRLLCCLLLGLGALAAPLQTQSPRWTTEQQSASWYSAFVDHAVTDRTALWFDGHWRRMGLGADPQQLLLRPGVQRTIAPGVRVAAGYTYVATAPYGRLPLAEPLREQRIWQQLLLSHRAGGLTVSHRYRWEQRWLSSLSGTGDDRKRGAPRYGQRVRYMVRAQGEVPGVTFRGRPVLAFGWDELLLPVGHDNEPIRLAQNRLGGGLGVPIDRRQRLEVGYMNLWNGFSGLRANEVNHTLTVAWVWISAK